MRVCVHSAVLDGFGSAGVRNWFATVEKIIATWIMVRKKKKGVQVDGVCVCVSKWVVIKMLSYTLQ